ncbi:sushi domain-containing protein 1 isoform X2 [Hyperolius riggenbachi]|uniref:sushi domain-containing protein 1 isoform X2 n=1 Tax=Hyperolius riggenbachi TaxID=752182 RepID=UPI0035A29141
MMTLRTWQPVLLLLTSLLLQCFTKGLPVTPSNEVCKTCHPNATCIETENKFSCMCNFGLFGNGRTQCMDKNECQSGAFKICGEHTACHNTHGSYYCICLEGYRPSNNHDNFIPNDGTYCTAVDCGPPPVLPYSEMILSENTTLGSHAIYTCAPGFLGNDGHNTSVCTANGTWERASLTCKAIDCGMPPKLQNTHADSVNGTKLGDRIIYTCNIGFIAEKSNETTAICSNDGSWRGALINCRAIDCGLPQVLPDTVIRVFNSSSYGSKVTFTCANGFTAVSGESTSVCSTAGQWEGASLVCRVADCGPPPSVQNATPGLSWNTTYGSTLTYQCSSGYIRTSGNETATCNEEGQWVGANLVCREINCGQPPSLNNTDMQWNGSAKLGSEVRYTCRKGFYNPEMVHVSRCASNGSWEETTFSCTEVDCGIPLTIEQTDWLWNNQSTMGSYIYYRCKPGFKDNGENTFSQCLANATWELLNLTCTVKEDLIRNLKILNETCLKWTTSSDLFGRELQYQFIISGVRWHDKNFVDEKMFNLSTKDENPVVCLELLPKTNYTITITTVSTELPAATLNVTLLTTSKQMFGNITLFNDSCLTWKRNSPARLEVYTVFIQGKIILPEGLFHNILFNFSTEETSPVLCLELPQTAEYMINITESSTKLSVYVTLNMTNNEHENSINQQKINETCLHWNTSLDGLQKIYKLYVKGGRWPPTELIQDLPFNIDTDQNVTAVCMDVAMDIQDPTNMTEFLLDLNGPIQNLTIYNETCLVWRRQSKAEELYVIFAQGHRWYQKDFKHRVKFNVTTGDPYPLVCLELQKTANYTVEIVSASFPQYPAQIKILSKLSEPSPPRLKLSPANNQLPKVSFQRLDKTGHISSYQVFVIRLTSWCSFTCESLEAVTFFSNISNIQGYVTAEFFPGDTSEHLELLVGDRQYYGDFYNAPLEQGKDYCIILRTISKMRTHTCTVVAEVEELSTTSRHHLTGVLLASVALACFILFMSYSVARCCNR